MSIVFIAFLYHIILHSHRGLDISVEILEIQLIPAPVDTCPSYIDTTHSLLFCTCMLIPQAERRIMNGENGYVV